MEDHPIAHEIRIWGPPGCGKTTYLEKQIKRAGAKYGKRGVLVTSFTKAAAIELLGKQLPLEKDFVGTLHAHCYRALGRPHIAETRISDWNKYRPHLRLTTRACDMAETETEHPVYTFGDELFAKLQVFRAKMIPPERWPITIRNFAREWTEWKRATRVMDFTDLIEETLDGIKVPPGRPNVVVVDEAQDLTRLQLSLVRQWGRHADYIMMAADDDQTIFSFAGASPEALLETDGEEYWRHVLSKSYRVPKAVHAVSQAWIRRVRVREEKAYEPRDETGEVRLFHRGNYKHVDAIVNDAEDRLSRGKTIMFLAPCSFMLEPLKRVLRERGLPFHNPYRRKRLDWNPLTFGTERHPMPVDRVCAYLKPRAEVECAKWTAKDLMLWTTWLGQHGGLIDGAAESIRMMSPTAEISQELLSGC